MLGRVTIVQSSGNFSIWCEAIGLSFFCRKSGLDTTYEARQGDLVEFEVENVPEGLVRSVKRMSGRALGSGKRLGFEAPAVLAPYRS